jgi:hypothetical protein
MPHEDEIFDESDFARKVVKIFRTLKKMEQNKHLEPNISESFGQLSEILFTNYRDNTSIGSGSVYGAKS